MASEDETHLIPRSLLRLGVSFYPFWQFYPYTGVSWYRFEGIWLWTLTWILLLVILYRDWKAARYKHQLAA